MTDIDVKARLIEAADFLDLRATEAEYKPGRWHVDVAVLGNAIDWLGPSHDALTATWPQAALVDMFSPATARLVSKWLRSEAMDVEMCDRINNQDPDNPGKTRVMYRPQTSAALALADQILKLKVA